MATPLWKKPFTDSLYGRISFDDTIVDLIQEPIVQRLRHVRLSNIDSIDMPGISNISRFEHVLGVAHLASIIKFRKPLSKFDNLALVSSALLHDWAITSYGHLIEEALQYVGTGFEHESTLREILSNGDEHVVGGIDFQILSGRPTNLRKWSRKNVGVESDTLIEDITKYIGGEGTLGRIISCDIDIDNIDNVFRMAFHMGINVDRGVPTRLAGSIVGVDDGGPIFSISAREDIETWCSTRKNVYQHLMLSERDFIGKIMMLYASVLAFENQEITKEDWCLVDHTLLSTFAKSKTKEVCEAVQRWISGDLWVCSPLFWLHGDRPKYSKLLEFSQEVSSVLGRECFAYGIKDKRDRHLAISFDTGEKEEFGTHSKQWLLGVGSSKRAAFKTDELEQIFQLSESYFSTTIIGLAANNNSHNDIQECLF
ncbi:metal-dependent phosphohydrolase-related protein [Citrifermentans bemidjiense Bem]|uniref:Metal-dependent phosphohydrolase-related protein n=1 Tax=Citrifermentans bemidjiense (strain ATCC BAA-1014 / DSM 16622 / JCM 12645 / Bem) TaxID=404380 RepID=B5EAP9_CITBB|nr:metal-dependent phosphohydrolase-like protein [Citrifermentans bemidjiense]ACH37358.1 metal-dependent phosphohydrolase-related protein [Citrifermentans bemidjiense Bem]